MTTQRESDDGAEISALTLARERAKRLRAAGDKLDHSFADIRRPLTIVSIFVPGVPIASFVAMTLNHTVREPSLYAVGAMAATGLFVNLLLHAIERVSRWRHRPEIAFERVLEKCLEIRSLPAPIDAALDQTLEAYFSLRKLGSEPDWKQVGYPMKDHLHRASERVVELLEWGRRLAIIGERLEKMRGAARETPEFRDTQTHYLAQCAQIAAAASAFSRVEAKVTLAYAALSASAARDSLAAGQLQELTATFEALTEVLSESEPGSRIVPPAEEQQVLIQGR
jgi:hypothetical protein